MNQISPITAPSAPASLAQRAAVAHRSRHVAPDCSGLNLYEADQSLRDLLRLYMDEPLLAHLSPHLDELGELAKWFNTFVGRIEGVVRQIAGGASTLCGGSTTVTPANDG